MRVSLFIPCFIDQLYPEVGIATVKLLKRFGVYLNYPQEQTCCGQPAFNTGYHKEARKLAEKFIKIFSGSNFIVAPSGSCVCMVRLLYDDLDLPSYLKNDLQEIKLKIFELSEFLVRVLKIERTGAAFYHKVTYHDSCHLLRELGISEEPRILLRNIEGIEFVEMQESTRCCGFGGTFSIKFPELSVVMGEDKINNILMTGAEYVAGCDSSCLMHISALMQYKNIPVKTIHLAQLLTEGW